ncbi:MarR family transcriptional regulator [Streptomyces sp. DSM 42041]|uniref:MarR family transcriptional regulator n=1 Tax=Streptomyces hazeniae TaxID=3075538 RepID=A0ABU2NR21_9ACTN|nr:MarR family transcriptional regulator [Streptomyces sp. DSM 42041]MDT0379415.1 MarR family transcriptional regulator [Streptomyces sp. DSM 42041]
MGASSAGGSTSPAAARIAVDVVELLEVLWEQGRNAVPTKPVSPSQLRVLHVLQQEDGINLRGLGELLGSAPPSVSRLCDRLEAMGLLERHPSPVSRRELELHLTRRAVTYLADLRTRREDALEAVLSRMPATERRRLLGGLESFATAARTAGTGRRSAPDDEARPA